MASLEQFAAYGAMLDREGEERERARQNLADFIARTAFIGQYGVVTEQIEEELGTISESQRARFVDELASIARETGWADVEAALGSELRFDREVRRAVGIDPDVHLYKQTLRHPRDIEHVGGFVSEQGPVHYWIPRKIDIRRYVRVAELAHYQPGRTGPIRILDVGGGSGFLAKLIADEGRAQGLEVEVVVVDPDERVVTEATRTFADTPELRFEVGTAKDALRRYGPDLPTNDREAYDALERDREALTARGREELTSIKATLAALEGTEDVSGLLRSPFGETAERFLRAAGVDLGGAADIEAAREAVARHYDERFRVFHKDIISTRDRQERLLMRQTRDPRDAKFDVVLNSWMPGGIDFTREIRAIGASAIIYALESGGATGTDDYGEGPGDLGRERSYGTGPSYGAGGPAYREVAGWGGLPISHFYPGDDGAMRYVRTFSGGQRSEVQCRRGGGISGISRDDLRFAPIADAERYPWERSLEELVGPKGITAIDEQLD
ncbi:hypothetical protein HY635_00105 [Candidatus Uhrbacteria bacterium]|nr:hypothetical protein [Candidatus Uhrbacteria bacterium]